MADCLSSTLPLYVDNTSLDLDDDIFLVRKALFPVAAQWRAIGEGLGVKGGKLDEIHINHPNDSASCMGEVVREWLKRNCNAGKFGEPTWRKLVEVVGSPVGGNNLKLAVKIAKEHPDNTGGKPLNQSKFSRPDSPTMEPQEQHQATDRMDATSHPICEAHTENRLLRLPSTQPPITFPKIVKNSWKNLFKTAKNKTASTKPAQCTKDEHPSLQRAIQRLQESERMLNERTEFLERRIEEQIQKAKKYGMANKEAAIEALRCKKMLERQLRKVDGTLTTAEYQMATLQSAVSNTMMYTNMKYVARTLKATQHHLPIDVDDIHDTVAAIQEQKAIHDELSDAIAHSMAFGQEESEDEEELLRRVLELEVSLPNTSVTEALSNISVADCDIHSPRTIPIKEMEASSQGNSSTPPVLTYCCDKLPEVPVIADKLPEVPVTADKLPEVPVIADKLPEVPVIADKLPEVPVIADKLPEVPVIADKLPEVPVIADKLPEVPVIADKLPEVPVIADKLPEVPVIADKLPEVSVTDRTNKAQNKKSSRPKETAV